ncbi:hypothetical protein ACHAWF_011517 [Thalassiosira exigua]
MILIPTTTLFASLVSASAFSVWRSNVAKYPGTNGRRRSPWSTHTISAAKPRRDEDEQTQESLYQCEGCNRIFESRNALFRHLRGQDDSSSECSLSAGNINEGEVEVSMSAVIRYGYFDASEGNTSTNELVATIIHESFIRQTDKILDTTCGGAQHFNFSTSALTYSTAAKLRQPSLRQDEEVACASSEVLSFNYRLRSNTIATSKWKEYGANTRMLENMQTWLDGCNCTIQIRLHQMDALVPRSSNFYAERSCSQRSYRFLLPMKWVLPSIDEHENGTSRDDTLSLVRDWWSHISPQKQIKRIHQPRSGNECHPKPAHTTPPFIKKLKQTLKAIESETVPNRRSRRREMERGNNIDDSINDDSSETSGKHNPVRLAPGRFGQLWRKRRICWSNFAHPHLSGNSASPGHEAVWRTLDRAKIVGFVDGGQRDEPSGGLDDTVKNMNIVLEFRADGFVWGQIPRVVSAVVAMTNGWLPCNFFHLATRPDVYLPAPPSPPCLDKRLYFNTARYHFQELTGNGMNFEKPIQPGSPSEQDWEQYLRERMLGSVSLADTNAEARWIQELRDAVSTDLKKQMEATEVESFAEFIDSNGSSGLEILPDADSPAEYAAAVDILRDIVKRGKWPATSDARSRVIKSRIISEQNSGSFTVVNDQVWEGDSLPLGNSLFPQLTKAVFELEKEIIRLHDPPLPAAAGMGRQSSPSLPREPSTHCAINRNAQFTPHVDSGRGLGQSLSMIVGLGNYTGGQILVEGKSYDVRYNGLEFDGWNLLHWTAPFAGERYSLVWFTPEIN